ncbi:response regulator transcription factor [Oxalobacteraceae bacterium OM1]|nr:response regulator transcription factor [Oxalobacteraceae bacterium OM1]
MELLLLASDPEDRRLAGQALARLGHTLRHAQAEDLAAVPAVPPAMLLLDWQAAGRHAASIVSRMTGKLPVLCLLPPGSADAMKAALGAGATDCQFKPLRAGELRARVQALLERAYPAEVQRGETLHFDRYQFEVHAGTLEHGGQPVALTRKEFDLALLFFRNLGRPLSRATMQEAVWGRHADIPSRTIDTHVSRVRSKLGLRPENGYRLAPVYSYGYRLEALADGTTVPPEVS